MLRRSVLAAVVLSASFALADEPPARQPAWLTGDSSAQSTSTAEPVFVPGVDSGGAGEQLLPGPGCRLELLCVNDAYCHQIWPGFWACVWMEGSACDSIWCESG